MPKLLGEKLQSYVMKQMAIRQTIHGSGVSSKRTPQDISLLNSKTSWVKLASGLDITEERLRKENIQDRFIGRNLAREHVLFSGLSSFDEENDRLIQRGTVPPNNLFSTVNGVYSVNPTNDPYTGFGAVPMPGIESIDVQALNKGSIKETTIKISAYSPEQFKVIDLLYLRIGYTVFLEWGWSHYIDNNTGKMGKDITSFIDSKEGWFKENYWNKDGGGTNEILQQVVSFRSKYSGNWDGFLGRVKNFTWTIDENGKYSITLKLISLGDIIESLKTNISPSSDVLASINQGYAMFLTKNDSGAANVTDASRITDSLSSYIVLNLLYIGAQDSQTGQPIINPNSPPPSQEITSYYTLNVPIGALNVINKPTNLKGQFIFNESSIHCKSNSQSTVIDSEGWFDNYDDLGEQIEKQYPGAKKIENFVEWQNTSTPGAYWTPFLGSAEVIAGGLGLDNQLDAQQAYNIENQSEITFVGVSAYLKVNVDFSGITTEGQSFKDVCYFNYNMGDSQGQGEATINEKGLYMRLGHILSYINKYVIPFSNGNPNNKIVNIDNVSKSNYMRVTPYAFSYDPRVCIVNGRLPAIAEEHTFFPELEEFIVPRKNEIWPKSFSKDSGLGYTMNIYMNCSHIMGILKNNVNKKGDINLFKFLSEICNSINKAMGGVNNLEPVVNEDFNIIELIDASLVVPKKNKKGDLKVLGYGKDEKGNVYSNFVRNFSIKTELTNGFATMAAVGSTAAGYVKGTENTMFSKWNNGLIDPFKEKLEIEQDTNTKTSLKTPVKDIEKSIKAKIKGVTLEEYIEIEEKVLDEVDPAISYAKEFLDKGNSSFGLTEGKDSGESYYESKIGDQPAISDEIIDKNLVIATEFWRWYQGYLHQISSEYSSPTTGFIPISLDLEIEGISGIKIYNSLNVDTGFLPKNYGESLNFIIKNVDHSLNNGDWVTKIKTIVVANSNSYQKENGENIEVFTLRDKEDLLQKSFQNSLIENTIARQDKDNPKTFSSQGSRANVDTSLVVGQASQDTVNDVYPRSTKWRNGPEPVRIPITNPPKVAIDLNSKREVPYKQTLVTYSEYVAAAKKVTKKINPSITPSQLKAVVTAALSVAKIEQGVGSKIKGFNNNLTGVESSGFKVFKNSDVNGKVYGKEGGTGLRKAYYSFTSIDTGLAPLISKIIERNMFPKDPNNANEFAWRYARDWNGYGFQTKSTFKNNGVNIKAIENRYLSSLKQV